MWRKLDSGMRRIGIIKMMNIGEEMGGEGRRDD